MRIATARYFAAEQIKASGLAPVASTVGFPKFPLGYHFAGLSPHVAPRGIFGRDLEEAAFRKLYYERLDSIGAKKIEDLLKAIAKASDAKGVVLLCFCDLDKGYCHRRMFAEWWELNTGQNVPEITADGLVSQATIEVTGDY